MNDTLFTSVGPITMVQAQPAELDIVTDILEEVARWLVSQDIDQWQPGQFVASHLPEIIDRLNCGEVYLAKHNEEAVGTLTLQWRDTLFWGDVPDDAGYVHRLAVRRAFAGIGLGRQMLQWAERTAAARGKAYLRLDCSAENQVLRRYYERAGFNCKGELQGDGWCASLYEKQIMEDHR